MSFGLSPQKPPLKDVRSWQTPVQPAEGGSVTSEALDTSGIARVHRISDSSHVLSRLGFVVVYFRLAKYKQ